LQGLHHWSFRHLASHQLLLLLLLLLLWLLLLLLLPSCAAPCLQALQDLPVLCRTPHRPHRWMLPGAAVQWLLPPHQQLQQQPAEQLPQPLKACRASPACYYLLLQRRQQCHVCPWELPTALLLCCCWVYHACLLWVLLRLAAPDSPLQLQQQLCPCCWLACRASPVSSQLSQEKALLLLPLLLLVLEVCCLVACRACVMVLLLYGSVPQLHLLLHNYHHLAHLQPPAEPDS
jgi:hypothetical protein